MDNESVSGESDGAHDSSDSAETETKRLGRTLRELRQSRRMTLTVVAEKAKITPSFLSQIERGLAVPSLPALYRIARVFDFTPSDLLEARNEELPILTRRTARARVEAPAALVKERLLPSTVRTMQVYSATIPVGGSTGEPQSHGDSDELLLVVSGTAVVEVDSKSLQMESGDSLYYRTSSIHSVRNSGKTELEVLWITAPPTLHDGWID
ncbi:cupin domain-containing protein [Leucobacter chironomi]|uniref:cupin domain-containing protein n=1 Tax=Leucobacter chironomi TaxID=491918 RepID=UPI0004265234|nr:XRE family transcriptional regulator [Leucobacter chironomi]